MIVAAIYARKSTEQHSVVDEAKSVTRQIEHARQYADRKGWTVADEHIYVDDGISGAEFANRPGFMRLMNAVKPLSPFQVLVMSEDSRLGREAIETAYALKQLIAAGVRVFYYLEDRERTLDSPTDKIMMALAGYASEMEREQARHRMTDTMRRKAKAGHVTGGRVFGYANAEILGPSGARSHVERRIVEEEAAVVRRIFSLSADGYGLKAITRQLNDEGATSPRAQQGRRRLWAVSSVREALFRELYRGAIVWNKTQKRDRWGQHRVTVRPAAEWLSVPAPHLQIVSDDLWERAHARLAAARAVYKGSGGRPPLGSTSPYLLTNLTLCGLCGGSLHVRSRKHSKHSTARRFFLGCSNYHFRGQTACYNKHDVPMDDANAVVLEAILDDLLDETLLAEAVEKALDLVTSERTADPLPAIENEIRRVEQERERFVAAVAAGGSLDAILGALSQREATLKALKTRRSALRAQQRYAPPIDRTTVRGELVALAQNWRRVLQNDIEHARPVLMTLLQGRLTFTPTDTPRQWQLRGTGTLAGLFQREIFHSVWRPHPGPSLVGAFELRAHGLIKPRNPSRAINPVTLTLRHSSDRPELWYIVSRYALQTSFDPCVPRPRRHPVGGASCLR